MRAPTSGILGALSLVVILSACSSKPVDMDEDVSQSRSSDQTEESTEAQTQPVVREDDVQGRVVRPVVPLTAEGYHEHASLYDGTLSTRTLYFAFDRSDIPAAAIASLSAHADYLKRNRDARIRLEGHTDERGTREYNMALGERRSQSVERFLRVAGVSASQIETVSYGEEKPAAFGQDEMSWAKNRRVVINYLSGRP